MRLSNKAFLTKFFIITLAIISLVLFTYRRVERRRYISRPQIIHKDSQRTQASKTRTPAKEVASKPLPTQKEIIATKRNTPSAPPAPAPTPEQSLYETCQNDWQTIAQQSLLEFEEEVLSLRSPFSAKCREQMLKEVKDKELLTFLNYCAGDLANESVIELENQCLPLSAMARAQVIRLLYQSSPSLSEAIFQDTTGLINQLAANLINPAQLTEEDIRYNLNLANTIIEQDPGIYAAYKAKLLSHFLLEKNFNTYVDDSTYDRIYDELLSFSGPEDQDLIRFPFYRLNELGRYEDLIDLSTSYLNDFPEDSMALSYLALALWKSGEEEEAYALLEEAANSDNLDENALLLQLMDNLQSGSFKQVFDINFDLLTQ